jgi:hypothetical protein
MEEQPLEILFNQALRLNYSSLESLCKTSSYLRDVLCLNENFWKTKFQLDYHWTLQNYDGSWKKLYLDYSNVWSVGNNSNGQLGLGNFIDENSSLISLNKNALSIASGSDHTIMIDMYHNLWSWGNNKYGQLGTGDFNNHFVPTNLNMKAWRIYANLVSSIMIDFDYNVWMWGVDNNNVANNIPTKLNIKALDCVFGPEYLLMIDLDYNVWIQYGEMTQLSSEYKSKECLWR